MKHIVYWMAALLLTLKAGGQEIVNWQLREVPRVAHAGEEISTVKFTAKDWHKATVPGTVLTTLVNNSVYPEPLYGENNRPDRIPESLCRTEWWYRGTVSVPAAYKGKKIWLNFDGINYIASVWVNGRNVGDIKGAFIRGVFDITALVEAGQDAAVAVKITPPYHPGVPAEHTLGAGNGPIGGIGRLDGPTFACSLGWDWMPGIRDRNIGIWQKVFLSATGPVVVKNPHVTTDLPLPRTDSADLSVSVTVQNVTDTWQEGVLKGAVDDVTFEQAVKLPPRLSQTMEFTPRKFKQLRMANPKLWWPNGYGEQNMYTLRLTFESNGTVSDRQDVPFGIREITYDIPGTEISGSGNLSLGVNGVRVYCKGGNWGMDEAMKRIPRERMEAWVRLHQLANFNMIRNWGGMSTSETFYEMCDKYGILVWDEFFQFNDLSPLDLDMYIKNCYDKALRFRNHPSIALWCGRNEAMPPKYMDDALRGVLLALDSTRWYQSNSGHGRGMNSGGPYGWVTPWEYYHFAEQKNFNKNETFKTEIGAISVPTLESIQGMMPESSWNVINDDWAEHDFTAGGGRKHPALITKRYGEIANLADFVRKGQLINYEGYRAMYEGRQGLMFKPVQGILTWMSHPAQPSFVWQIYHYDLEPNSSFFAVRKACEPVHIQLNDVGNGTLQVINNLAAPFTGKARIEIFNLDGASPCQRDYHVNAAASEPTNLGTVEWPESLSAVHFVKLELRDTGGGLVSDNFYWRGVPKKVGEPADNYTALNTLPVINLDVQPRLRAADGRIFIDVTVRNPAKQVALLAHFQLRRGKSKARVLPVYYSDNYVSLAPGEEKTLTIEAAQKDLQGERPLIVVDGWNVSVSALRGADVEIALNENTQVARYPQTGLTFTDPLSKIVPEDEVRFSAGGFARDGFTGDPGYSGTPGWITRPIDVSALNSAPEAIYQTVRWGENNYVFELKKSGKYTVRLHFAEQDSNTKEGKRVFNVSLNGKTVLEDLDVYKEAGQDVALVKQFFGIETGKDNRITVGIGKGRSGTPQVSGIEILKE
ncbi:MAG: hypothetical protein LBD30_08065 [Verrucomicrobiales bacterium]|nr:hypothetical protein [Verrucomicrobiales bacterium]